DNLEPEFIFLDDNAKPHRPRVVLDFLENEKIGRLKLPPHNPDRNPVEHGWDMLQRAFENTVPPPARELGGALLLFWDNLPQNDIDHLFLSIPKHCQEVIDRRGGHTHY
ncbi:DDE 3 domain containing protein, partial [Asbolus verrucosus]